MKRDLEVRHVCSAATMKMVFLPEVAEKYGSEEWGRIRNLTHYMIQDMIIMSAYQYTGQLAFLCEELWKSANNPQPNRLAAEESRNGRLVAFNNTMVTMTLQFTSYGSSGYTRDEWEQIKNLVAQGCLAVAVLVAKPTSSSVLSRVSDVFSGGSDRQPVSTLERRFAQLSM